MTTIALIGTDRGHPSHRELNALIPRLHDELGADAAWETPRADLDVSNYDGVWLVPGGPYDDDAAVIRAIHDARVTGQPFLGTCSGLQYAVLEHLQHVVGVSATHEEADGARDDNAVAALACSLRGEQRLVTPSPDSRFAGWVDGPALGMHYCGYAPTEEAIGRLVAQGVVIGATAPDAGPEVLEFPGHPFFVASLFQPHIGASHGGPIHPMIRAFVAASAERSRKTTKPTT